MRTFAPFSGMRGFSKASHFLYINITAMIERHTIQQLVEEWLQQSDYVLVDITISSDNRIVVEIDHADGVWIDDCASLSRYIEEHLDRDAEDYELEVGSAGLGQPFKVPQQYVNHVGKAVEVVDNAGVKRRGVLTHADDAHFTVSCEEKQTVEGKKRPQKVNVDYTYGYDEVKSVKYLIAFK